MGLLIWELIMKDNLQIGVIKRECHCNEVKFKDDN
jgi:hypothetical protein